MARVRPPAHGEAIRGLRRSDDPPPHQRSVQIRMTEGGTITVCCRAATWAQELDLLQGDLLARLNEALDPRRVERLRFTVGDELADDFL